MVKISIGKNVIEAFTQATSSFILHTIYRSCAFTGILAATFVHLCLTPLYFFTYLLLAYHISLHVMVAYQKQLIYSLFLKPVHIIGFFLSEAYDWYQCSANIFNRYKIKINNEPNSAKSQMSQSPQKDIFLYYHQLLGSLFTFDNPYTCWGDETNHNALHVTANKLNIIESLINIPYPNEVQDEPSLVSSGCLSMLRF